MSEIEAVEHWDFPDPEKHVPAISAANLMEMDIAPKDYVVRGLLPTGLGILGGAPKVGKSWMALDLCLRVATGAPLWGLEVRQGVAWYLCLEDEKRRMRQRLACITDEMPQDLYFTTVEDEIGTMADLLEARIYNFIAQHPTTRLIVIDTLQIARGTSKEPTYGGDYDDVRKIKQIADKCNVAILAVHHLRKQSDRDPVNKLSGTTGISGAADTLFILDRSTRLEDVATLTCTGRDILARELELRFDKTACVWDKVSDSMDREGDTLPPELERLMEFMKQVGSFYGTNTAFTDCINERYRLSLTPKKLKQMMNRWCCVLLDRGLSFRNIRTGPQRLVEITYTPPMTQMTQVTQE